MSCGLLVDYSSSSDEDEGTAAKKRGDNGEKQSDLSRSVDPGRRGASRGSHAQMTSTTADRETLLERVSSSLIHSPPPPPAKRLKLSRVYDGSNLVDDDSSNLIVDVDSSALMGGGRADAPAPPLSSPLPLPAAILDMFKEKEEVEQGVESRADHEGRVRSFPHVRGNWATHVYVPVQLSNDVITGLISFGENLNDYFKGHAFHMFPPSDLHVSLSRTVPVQHHCIEPLVDAVRSKVSLRTTFDLRLSGIAVYVNDEKTRSFVGLEVDQGHREIKAFGHLFVATPSEVIHKLVNSVHLFIAQKVISILATIPSSTLILHYKPLIITPADAM